MKGKSKKEAAAKTHDDQHRADARPASAAPEPAVGAEPVEPAAPDGPAEAVAAPEAPSAADQAIAALTDRLLRLQADFDNFRKRTLREKSELIRQANENLVVELLPVLDHMDLALEAATRHGADDALIQGFRLVGEQFQTVLSRFGVTPLDATSGPFDPNIHEAIAHLPSPDVRDHEIITQTRRGYTLGDRLLRPARVVVSSGPPSAPASGGGAENPAVSDS